MGGRVVILVRGWAGMGVDGEGTNKISHSGGSRFMLEAS